MPIYQYTCKECTYTIEKLKKVEDRDLIEACDKCKNHMKRNYNGFSKVYFTGVKGSETAKKPPQ